jgi:hypothetical protein
VSGVARIFEVSFSGFMGWWLWRNIYLSKSPRFEKKLRVALDWTLGPIVWQGAYPVSNLSRAHSFDEGRNHRQAPVTQFSFRNSVRCQLFRMLGIIYSLARFSEMFFMHNAIPLILAALIAVAIIVIGCFYLASPERISGTFGLKPPASDADTRAWLRPKGIRDIASGLIVLTMMLTADTRLVGIALLVEAVIPFGDMSIILGSGGSRSRALSVHGVTCTVMLVVGLLLIHAI